MSRTETPPGSSRASRGREEGRVAVAWPIPDRSRIHVTPPPRGLLAWLLEGPGWSLLRPLVDLVAMSGAVLLTVRWPGDPVPAGKAGVLLALPLLVLLALWARGMYGRRMRLDVLDGVAPVLGAISIATMLIVFAQIYVVEEPLELGVLGHAWVLSAAFVGTGRVGVALAQRLARTRWGFGKATLIVGAGHVGHRVARRLHQLPEYGLRPVGFLDVDPRGPESPGLRDTPVLGVPDDLELIAALTGAEHVVFAFFGDPDRDLVELVQRCEHAGLQVTLVPRLFESINDRASYESLGGLPLLGLQATNPHGWQFAVKHALDRVAAALMLLALSPVLVSLALAVRMSSPGPVFFRQRRVGYDGRAFDLLKFRSMAQPKPGAAFRPGP